MDALAVRSLLFNRKLKSAVIPDAIIDSWESVEGLTELTPLKGQLSVLELKGADTSRAAKLAVPPGEENPDKILSTAVSICMALVLTENKERIFNDNDMQAVAEFGLSVLMPLEELISQVSGLKPKAVAAATNFSSTTPTNGSSSSSVESSVVEAMPSGVNA